MGMRFTAVVFISCMLFSFPASALIGGGIHWGFDFSVDMEDEFDEPLSLNAFKSSIQDGDFLRDFDAGDNQDQLRELVDSVISYSESQGEEVPIISGDMPFYLSRGGFERNVINFGGKVFFDKIPAIDAVELSCNFGVWEYDASLKYPVGMKTGLDYQGYIDNPDSIRGLEFTDIMEMDEIPLTLETFDLSYFGLNRTPYAKFHLDATIRKNLIAKPDKAKYFRLYLGGGPSLHFATPVLSKSMAEDLLKDIVEEAAGNPERLVEIMNDQKNLKPLVKELIKGMSEPKFGMHIVAGLQLKIPVMPIGFYGDCKYMIPFGDYDKGAKLDGYGFLFNTGIAITI